MQLRMRQTLNAERTSTMHPVTIGLIAPYTAFVLTAATSRTRATHAKHHDHTPSTSADLNRTFHLLADLGKKA